MAKKIEYIISAKDKTQGALKRAASGFKSLGKSAKASLSKIGSLAKGAAIGLAAMGAAAIAVGAKMVAAFAQQQAAELGFAKAVELAGGKVREALPAMKQLAADIQAVTTVGDEATLEMAALGLNMGISKDQIEQASVAAVGLSEAYGIDLQSAMKLVAKASAGQTSELSRYGIVLDESLSPQEKFNAVLQLGAEKFSIAEANAKTLEGAQKQLSNTIGDAKEAIGEQIAVTFDLQGKYTTLNEKISTLLAEGKVAEWAERVRQALEKLKPVLDAAAKAFALIGKVGGFVGDATAAVAGAAGAISTGDFKGAIGAGKAAVADRKQVKEEAKEKVKAAGETARKQTKEEGSKLEQVKKKIQEDGKKAQIEGAKRREKEAQEEATKEAEKAAKKAAKKRGKIEAQTGVAVTSTNTALERSSNIKRAKNGFKNSRNRSGFNGGGFKSKTLAKRRATDGQVEKEAKGKTTPEGYLERIANNTDLLKDNLTAS